MPRYEDGRVVYEGGRRFLTIAMGLDYLGTEAWFGWFAFRRVQKICARQGCTIEQLEHRYTEENYGHIKAVFEVMPRG